MGKSKLCKFSDRTVIFMYWILNCLPLIAEVIIDIYYLLNKTQSFNPTLTTMMWFWVLILRQIYLLCINIFYIHRRIVSYQKSIVTMLCVIITSVFLTLLLHKLEWGVFIGDVPEGIYLLLVCIPSVIVIIGISIYYFIKKT